MSNLQSVVLTLSLSYALIGALLLIVLVYARLPWSAKAVAVVVTSAFYIASFVGVRGLLGWASVDRLPAAFKLLQARIVEPHSLEGDPGSIYLWVEALDDGNRPSGVPRAYRIPYSDKLAEKTDKAQRDRRRAARRAAAPPILAAARAASRTPPGNTSRRASIIETSGGDPSTGGGSDRGAAPATRWRSRRCLPPRMPPKDVLR